VADSMAQDLGHDLASLRVDGGAAANNLLMQMQADQLQVTVERAEVLESTAYGAALLAGLGVGIWSSVDEVASLNRVQTRFTPGVADEDAAARWLAALRLQS